MSLVGRCHSKLVYNRRMNVLAGIIANTLPQGAHVLDVGCGDGRIDSLIKEINTSIKIEGIDVLVRKQTCIPVTGFDGHHIPFGDNHFDAAMFIDVLHHTDDPLNILKEAMRVTRNFILIKDHTREGILAEATLRFMDYVGNAHYGVRLPYNYLNNSEWDALYEKAGLRLEHRKNKLGLYPFPAGVLFERNLHFWAVLNCNKGGTKDVQ